MWANSAKEVSADNDGCHLFLHFWTLPHPHPYKGAFNEGLPMNPETAALVRALNDDATAVVEEWMRELQATT